MSDNQLTSWHGDHPLPWRVGSSVARTIYDGHDELIGVMDTRGMAERVVRAVNGTKPTNYPETRFLTLCQLDGRKSGDVTVGESRLPAAMVLDYIAHCGEDETRRGYPQLTDGEMAVLVRLVADIAARREDQE